MAMASHAAGNPAFAAAYLTRAMIDFYLACPSWKLVRRDCLAVGETDPLL